MGDSENRPQFLNQHAPIDRHQNRLPHWSQDNSTFFLTIRLGDSIPRNKLDELRHEREIWLQLNPPPWTEKQELEYHERFSGKVEKWLDEMHGSCALRSPACANAVSQVLMKFDGARFRHHAWIVMPNHVHALFSLLGDESLPKIVGAWKGASAREVNLIEKRTGPLWQKDYFDRLIRDEKHFWNCARYIRRNPKKAGLKQGEFLLFESGTVRERLDATERSSM
jgi:REP element-mobilizing transposase RayT